MCIAEITHRAVQTFPKLEKYSIGITIEKLMLECIEACFQATAQPLPVPKLIALAHASAKFDALKVYFRLCRTFKIFPDHAYAKLIPHCGAVGQMLGGWLKEARLSACQS